MSRRKLIWTREMVQTLRTLRARGVPLVLCAEQIGVGYGSAVYKARELGLSGRMNRGRISGAKLVNRPR